MIKFLNKELINKTDAKSLKYYIGFCVIIVAIYIYSMITGWRYLSFKESSHTKEGRRSRIYLNHK